jgi:flagellar protein FliT
MGRPHETDRRPLLETVYGDGKSAKPNELTKHVDAAKYVRWHVMSGYEKELNTLLKLTEEVYAQALTVHSNMEDNEPEKLEAVQNLFERRQEVIEQLDAQMRQPNFQWAPTDRDSITRLQDYEQKLQPLLNGLHQSFLTKMNRINQNKQVSKKYFGAYQNTSTEGSFIDKRK